MAMHTGCTQNLLRVNGCTGDDGVSRGRNFFGGVATKFELPEGEVKRIVKSPYGVTTNLTEAKSSCASGTTGLYRACCQTVRFDR